MTRSEEDRELERRTRKELRIREHIRKIRPQLVMSGIVISEDLRRMTVSRYLPSDQEDDGEVD